MPSFLSLSLLVVAAAATSWSLIGLYTQAMRAARRLEAPNDRSMHKDPVPVGAGIAIVATALLLWPWWAPGAPGGPQLAFLCGFAGLGALSWIDDRRGLSPAVRLGAQAIAVAFCLAALPTEARAVQFLPLMIERLLEGLAWLWFINLFNFMDGIDGLAGSEALAVAIGYLALVVWAGLDATHWRLALVIAASVAGYLHWNWHPAKVFMGDAGSIPLGFVLGWLLLDLALHGHWAAALILPMYFVADATLTLLLRAWRGEKPWEPHRQHFYQRAVLGGATPPAVVYRVGAVNTLLVTLALASVRYPLPAFAAAVALVGGLLAHLQQLADRRGS